MDVTIKDQPELRVAGIRHIGPYHEIGREFGKLGSIAGPAIKPGMMLIGVFHDDPATTPTDRLRSDAAITLPDGAHAPNGLVEHRVPAGRYATTIHVGPYEGLPEAWARLKTEWLPKSGHTMGHPSCEIYLNNPTNTPKPELRTEIRMRLA
jgi:AraC family transcriptional regulator